MSSGSATGNPRNKVGLKPGHSLMDWIRLGNSGKDLAGTGGAFLTVTRAQLAQHNKQDDAWICIRGKVYNVTSYMDFHPGGAEELLKGVGTDATKIFNEVHAWVNYESILQKCIVGHLKTSCDEDIDITSSLTPGSPTKMKPPSLQNGNKVPNKMFQMDWFQQVGTICLVFYTKTPCPSVCVLLENEKLLYVNINSRAQLLRLEAAVEWPCNLTVDGAGKVQLRFSKSTPELWSHYGLLDSKTCTLPEYWQVKVVQNLPVTHNTHQIDLQYRQNVINYIPPGRHVLVKASVREEEVVRPYTPVTLSQPSCVRLLVKQYPSGTMSSWLVSRQEGDELHISLPLGSFSLQLLGTATHLVLFAAGTGFTPMVSIINNALRNLKLKIQLIYFNKSENDIIWNDWLKLHQDNPRFEIEHVLSEPTSTWTGKTGHVSLDFLQQFLPTVSADIPNTHYVCVCGPMPFTKFIERCLTEDLGFAPNNYFCFLGQ